MANTKRPSFRSMVVLDKKSIPAWNDLKAFFSEAGKNAFIKTQKEVGQFLVEEALRELRRTLRKHDFQNGNVLSPATNAILMARQKLGSKDARSVKGRGGVSFNPKHHYPKTGKLTRAPLLRNEDLLESFKVMRVDKGWAVGIHWAKQTQQGGSMAKVAQALNDGYTIEVTEKMANFFKALRIAEEQAKAPHTLLQKRDESRRKAFFRRHRAILGSGTPGVPAVKAGDTLVVPKRPYLDEAERRFNDPANPIRQKAAEFYVKTLERNIKIRNDRAPSGHFDCEPDDGSGGMEPVDS
jgi:hypothetical protein